MAETPQLVVNVAEGVVIRPGDKVVIRFDRPIAPEDADLMRHRWKETMGDVPVVFVQADDVLVLGDD